MVGNPHLVLPGPLTAAAWAPFGWIPLPDTEPADAELAMEFAWGDPHVNFIGHTSGEIEHVDGGLICDRMYRHASHTQALLAMNGPSVIAVASPDVSFSDTTDIAAICAFVVRPLESFVLFRGTWHWGPFPIGSDPVRLFNVQGKGYLRDNECADLSRLGTTVIIGTPDT